MVAYKLYRAGIIDQAMWSCGTAVFRQQWLNSKAAQRAHARENESVLICETAISH
jgi:hypothetical protein